MGNRSSLSSNMLNNGNQKIPQQENNRLKAQFRFETPGVSTNGPEYDGLAFLPAPVRQSENKANMDKSRDRDMYQIDLGHA
jgi:hypothetical protein